MLISRKIVSIFFLLCLIISGSGCGDDATECPVPKSGTVSVTCLPDTLEVPWILSLPDGLKAIGVGDSTLTNMPVGAFTMSWQALNDYVAPLPDSLMMEAGQALEFQGTYVRPTGPTGTIEINITPAEATWSLDGNSWYAAHGTGDGLLAGVPIGFYSLRFGPIPGYFTPYPTNIFLSEGETESRVVAYVPEPELVFPDSPDKFMENFEFVYDMMDYLEYRNLMELDFQTILQQSTTDEYPDLGRTLDVSEELRIHQRMFSGQAVTDPNGELVPGIRQVDFATLTRTSEWTLSPPDDPFPGSQWAEYEVQILMDRGQSYSTLKIDGTLKFYVTSRDSLHEGSVRPYYRMSGQVDLTNMWKAVEGVSWGSAKALFR